MSFHPRPPRLHRKRRKHDTPKHSARVPSGTLTISFYGIGDAHRAPALGLRTLTGDEMYAFDTFKSQGSPKQILTIGASADNDIIIDDAAVSRFHCLLHRQNSQVFVHDCDSKNGVWLDDVRVQTGELHPQSTLTLGRTILVAYGSQDDQGAHIKAGNPDQLLLRALDLYGGIRAASRGLGMAYSTLRDKIRKLTETSGESGPQNPATHDKAEATENKRRKRTTQTQAKPTPAKRAGAKAARTRRSRAKRKR